MDLYCERTAPGLWNGPRNATANLASWVAAGGAVLCRRHGQRFAPELKLLVLRLVLLGAGSMALRQLDLPLCGDWPAGTHFAWHLLNACTLGLTTWALALARPVRGRT